MKNYDTHVVNFKDAVMNNSSTVNFEEDAVTDAAKALCVIMLTIYNYLK